MKLPDPYLEVHSRGAVGFTLPGAHDWLMDLVASGRTIDRWALQQQGASTLRGRGPTHDVQAPARGPDGRDRWVVRHYRRGGMVARLLDDRYLRGRSYRPHEELVVSAVARGRGVPTPAVVAGAVYPSGPFYRADLVTERIPDATSLAALVESSPGSGRATRALHAAARLSRQLAAAGIRHADLNAMNILIDDGGAAWVIDLDRGTVVAPGRLGIGAMRARLERSLHKIARRRGTPLSEVEWDALRAGFEGV